MRRRYFNPSMAVALVALVTAASGGAYAAVGSSPSTISACVRHSGGLYVAHRCAHGDSRLTWNAIGPQGPAGAQGPAGQPGPTGPQGAVGPAGAIGPSDAFAAHRNGPVALTVDPTGRGTGTTIASLPIPRAGSYVLFAKADLSNELGSNTNLTCEFVAGDLGSDGAFTSSDADRQQATILASGHVGTSLNVVHQYTGAGIAEVRCESSDGASSAANIRITAIRLGSVTDATLP
jgi:hypothetical protein